MSRAEHRLNRVGKCARCGLSKRFGKLCPPGFWMTRLERHTWAAMPEEWHTILREAIVRAQAAEAEVARLRRVIEDAGRGLLAALSGGDGDG